MPSFAELLEERKRSLGKAADDDRLEAMSKESKDTQQKLETLRKMIVNADTIDEAGKSIGEVIESIRASHENLINDAAKTIDSLSQDKELALNAVKELRNEKAQAISELNKTRHDMEAEAAEQRKRAGIEMQRALDKLSEKSRNANDRATVEILKTFNKKLDKFDAMQNNILDLNGTMLQILAVLQTPKMVEFDDDGMPISVRPIDG